MTTDAFTAAAWEHWVYHPDRLTVTPSMAYAEGAGWARDYLAQQEPTDAEVEAAFEAFTREHFMQAFSREHGDQGPSSRQSMRAALSAARRDEEKR